MGRTVTQWTAAITVAAGICATEPAFAQENRADEEAMAQLEGRRAADSASVANYFVGGLFASSGGFYIGLRASDNVSLAAALGVGFSVGVVAFGNDTNRAVPPGNRGNGGGWYEAAVDQAYRERLAARRRNAGVWGAVVGFGAWAGLIVLYSVLVPT